MYATSGLTLKVGVIPPFQIQPLIVWNAIELVINGGKFAGCQGLPTLDAPSNERAGLNACVCTSEGTCNALAAVSGTAQFHQWSVHTYNTRSYVSCAQQDICIIGSLYCYYS